MAGGQERHNLVGHSQMLLAVCLYAYPEAQADEIAMFIFENGGGIYNRGAISNRMKDLKMTRKAASTEAYQAFTPRNLLRAELFWSRQPPLGIFQVRRRLFVDFDECGLSIEQCNRSKGHSVVGVRIRKPGHYTRDTKLTVIMAVEPGDPNRPPLQDGSVERPRRWIWIRMITGTNAETFSDFCEHVCSSIEQSGDTERLFLWDNLSAHRTPLVHHTVEAREGPCSFRIVARPPYQPKYGPIEYVFCELICRLQDRVQPDWNTNILRQQIMNIASQIGMDGAFDRTFQHCGYQWH
jgi:hypothetical protein